jgi:hypothetical protein
MRAGHEGLTASVMTRLNQRARSLSLDPMAMLSRFVTERFLFRLGASPHASHFVLKGATLMPLWLGDAARPTRDADLAGFGTLTPATLAAMVADVFAIDVEPDGVVFDRSSVRIGKIREGDEYGGYRINAVARIGRSRIPLQVDVGIGDAVSPSPEVVELPAVLDFTPPKLRAYRPETSIAEKFHAIATLGDANSRMKDYYDIDRLAAHLDFEGPTLRRAIEQTFSRRDVEIPSDVPHGLTDEYASSAAKQMQWRAFARRLNVEWPFEEVVRRVRVFLMPVVLESVNRWTAGGPWRA